MLGDDEVYGLLLDAVRVLEEADRWPPDQGAARAFAEALDGVVRRFSAEPGASSDGFVIGELSREPGGRIVAKGELWVLTSGSQESHDRLRTEAALSSTDGGWVRIQSSDDRRATERLTRRQRAAALDRPDWWTHEVRVPAAA